MFAGQSVGNRSLKQIKRRKSLEASRVKQYLMKLFVASELRSGGREHARSQYRKSLRSLLSYSEVQQRGMALVEQPE